MPEYYAELDKEQATWPKRHTHYAHVDKDTNWEVGEGLGLSEEAIKTNFKYCCSEIGVIIDVYEDGTYKIIGVADVG